MTQALRAARFLVALVVLAIPVAHAGLVGGGGRPTWPTLVALAGGLLLRVWSGPAAVVFATLAVAPVWQVLTTSLGPEAVFEQVMPWLTLLVAGLAWPGRDDWREADRWTVCLAGWALVLALTGPVVAARELDFTTASIGAATANGAMGTSPELTAAFVLLTLQAQLAALLLFDWYRHAPASAQRAAWRMLAPGLAVACGVAVWQQLRDPAFLSREPWTGLHRAPGTLFDANAMAALAALIGPIVASSFVRPVRVPAWLWTPACWLLAAAAVVATGSRTALVALGLMALLQAIAAGRLAAMLGMVAMVGAGATFIVAHPSEEVATGHALGRLAGSVTHLAARPEEIADLMWGRHGYGPAAMAIVADHPVVGGGVGTFATLVGDYARFTTGQALPPDNAQNWWRHQAAELGLAGALPAFASSLLALGAVLQALWRRQASAASVAGLGLMSLVSPPTQHPILQVVIGLLLAHTVVRAAAPDAPARPTTRVGVAVVWLLALGCAAGTAVEGWRTLRPPYRAVRFQFVYNYGTGGTEATPYGDGRWMSRRAVAVVPAGGAQLVLRFVAPHDDLAAAPVRITVATQQAIICTHDAVDHAPFECRVPITPGTWPYVRMDVSRAWRREQGVERAAVVSARYEPWDALRPR